MEFGIVLVGINLCLLGAFIGFVIIYCSGKLRGHNGADGAPGMQGPQGARGEDGKDGKCCANCETSGSCYVWKPKQMPASEVPALLDIEKRNKPHLFMPEEALSPITDADLGEPDVLPGRHLPMGMDAARGWKSSSGPGDKGAQGAKGIPDED